ncbi:Squalene--hopene cyclase [Aquicella siphonis]|uniref:Squalene--hopene cyclase n=1 Tax=Aquicella siphonis TaxID=254247 RepID=A0A5E4PIU1_9COXI|nr:hypothetical protein [Aquicella siphonis]VVC76864.1 Squalene--hopene cyclase [Aquicella siphonis]
MGSSAYMIVKQWLFVITLALFTVKTSAAAVTPPPAAKVSSSILHAETFIQDKLDQRKYHLSCHAIGSKPCPVSNSGELLVLNIVYQAMSARLSPSMRQNIAALVNLKRKNTRWLWGYNGSVLIDSDDTSNALLLLLQLGQPVNINDLQVFYKSAENAYTTLVTSADARPATFASEANNTGIHPEVNANIFQVFHQLRKDDRINYDLLLKFQSPQGYWEGYFYPGKYYATYLNLKLFCASKRYPSAVSRALDFIAAAQNKDGSWGSPGNAYETALALNSMLVCGYANSTTLMRGIRYLISSQNQYGAWSTDHPIWMYAGHDSPLLIWVAYDHEDVVTTALALQALRHFQKISETRRQASISNNSAR